MKAPGNYYTFRMVDPGIPLFECKKWDDFSDEVVGTYQVRPRQDRFACSCPAWKNDCKHVKCAKEALANNWVDKLPTLRWTPKGGWIEDNEFT